ncbi:GntR family transcriptional regulator [Oryzifoliimicrobium ureilyticus]|uniref:GntR family transcriptional regulator n=1 Tax=Oryzifoliimicrobium ureilyticus TaxID=3113724 RepID=UPI0030767D91
MDRTSLFAELKRRVGDLSSGPLYKRLSAALLGLVQEGLLKPGTSLPAERDLAEGLDLARVTVRSAYRDLIAAGILESRQGSGTSVVAQAEKIEHPLWRLSSFSAEMRSRGQTPVAKVLSRAINNPTPEEAFLMGLEPSEEVLRLDRLRLADGRPLAIERAVVPLKFLGGRAAGEGSLYEALAAFGHRPVKAAQRLTAVVLDRSSARLLEVEPGAPALLIEQISRLVDQRVVEYTRSHFRGDAYDFITELKLGDNG